MGAALGAIIGKTFIGKALGSVFGGKQTVEDTGRPSIRRIRDHHRWRP
ncbi:hypothetical protein [Massilia sp. NP310]|nr:hypothetical protein [Massilia sp. NP310]QYG01886.1 hypothetical protein KY496_00010 [Massilia sp. NP310]